MKARVLLVLFLFASVGIGSAQSQTASPIPESDSRYKVDILVVVAHPDDDIEVAAYLSKVIEQQHKRAAVVYMTRGNSGGNAVGEEQAHALADIREMEARQSCEDGNGPGYSACCARSGCQGHR